jgi:CPA2 family monovalent cation:H+ antiporter-2
MDIYLQVAICFAAIGLSAFAAEKTRLFFSPFYILAGFLFGPNVIGAVTDTHVISLLGEIGVVFLLFFLGLEFSLHTLLKQKRVMLVAGAVDFAVNFGLGFGLGMLLGLGPFLSLALAGAIYMSSSGIITKSLIELQISKNPEGHLIMGVMVFEDLVMIGFLAIVSAGMTPGAAAGAGAVLVQLAKSLVFCGAILLFARFAPRVIDRILSIKKRELLLLVFFGLVLIVTAVGKLFGVSEALSAFFLGMAFSGAKNVKNIEQKTVIFRDLFGSVFFFSFGMALTFTDIAAHWDILLYCLALAVGGKLISSLLITKILKCEAHMSLFIGFLTIPRGEFSLLISRISARAVPFVGPVMVTLAFITTVISALVLKFSKMLCKLYNVCIIFPRSRIKDGDWGEVD